MVGPSRKRFLGRLTGEARPDRRVAGTVAACLEARRGGATNLPARMTWKSCRKRSGSKTPSGARPAER